MTQAHTAEILTIGDELLSGETVDTNSNYLDAQLESWGWIVGRHTTVADDVDAIAAALHEAAGRAALVITSGGVGPTEDDLTLGACAQALGCGLRLDEELLARIEARFRSFGREMTPNNRRQAMLPEIGEPIVNESGSAPGFRFTLGTARVYVLPGVPREVQWLTEKVLGPELDRGAPVIFRRTVRTMGVGESRLATQVEPVVQAFSDRVRFGYRAVGMETHVKLAVIPATRKGDAEDTAGGSATADAKPATDSQNESATGHPRDDAGTIALLDQVEAAIRSQVGDAVFGIDDTDLVAALAARLLRRGATVATAESCTGGLIGTLLTGRPGSSEYYLGGCVTYSDDSKVQLLGVDNADLEIYGAVSEKVVQQMAKGVRRRLHADWGLAATGISGPDGGTKDKPVGTVFVAVAGPDRLQSKRLQLAGDREMVRMSTAKYLIDWLRRSL